MSHTIHKQYSADLRRLNETNYHLLVRLVPGIRAIHQSALSAVDDCVDLHLRILEHSRYTTTFALTCYLGVGDAWVSVPDLWIRMYHDAKVAEAIARRDGSSPANHKTFTWNQALDTDIKWKLNHFMERWLRDCLQRGHCFATEDAVEDGPDSRSLAVS